MEIVQNRRGFTLLELLVSVTIAGILFISAFSWYSKSLIKSRRLDGMMAMAKDQLMLEHCFAQYFSYDKYCSSFPKYPHPSAQGFYRIEIKNQDEQSYTLEARPLGAQAKDLECMVFLVTETNHRSALSASGSERSNCWG